MFDHPPWQQLARARGPLEAPLDVNVYSSHRVSGALSLSMEEGRSTFGFMVGIWVKF